MKNQIKQTWADAVESDPKSLDDWPVDRLAEAIDIIDEMDNCLAVKDPGLAKQVHNFFERIRVPIQLCIYESLDPTD